MKKATGFLRTVSLTLALVTMLCIIYAGSITADAVSGPRPSSKAGIVVGFTRFGDWEAMYLGSDKNTTAKFEKFKYNKKNNTLTLDNIGTDEEYYLEMYDMGDDFKINVKGKNSLGYIALYSDVKDRMNLTITGTGTLTVNPSGSYGAAIHGFADGKSNTKITIDNTVNLNLYGGENIFENKKEKVIEITGAKSSKQSDVFRIGGKKTGSTKVSKKKGSKGYNYKYGGYKLIIKKSGKSFLNSSSSSSSTTKKTTTKKDIVNSPKLLTKTVKGTYVDGYIKEKLSKKKATITDSAKYSDKYFTEKKGVSFQKGLAKLSVLASASAYYQSYSKDFLEDCEFSIVKQNYANNTKKGDHASYTIAKRKTGDITVFAVLIQGTVGSFTEPQWMSNANVGAGSVHTGFSKAESEIWKELDKHLKSKNVKKGKVKVWITGHSRGAAIANLLAKRLTDNKHFGKDNVYAYTFATPNVAVMPTSYDKKDYTNIRNYVNKDDIVPKVPSVHTSAVELSLVGAFKNHNYDKYGTVIVLNKDKENAMAKEFKKATNYQYYKVKNKIDPDAFLSSIRGSKDRLIDRVGATHTQTTYIAWLKVMYK